MVDLLVQIQMSNKGYVPNVEIPRKQYSVNYGSQATIPCTITANPTHTSVQWKIIVNGQEQNVDMQNDKYSGGTVNSPSLVIANAQKGDETFYICTAFNGVGPRRSIQTFLRVAGDVPNVEIPRKQYSVNYGSQATIPCTITANPSHTSVQWKIIVNGQEQNVDMQNDKYSGGTVNSPSLVIANAQKGDETFYICTAFNGVGRGRSIQTFLRVAGGPSTSAFHPSSGHDSSRDHSQSADNKNKCYKHLKKNLKGYKF
ncbi:unnamed protein product [Mytilus edulis]|uniref:Ig-like domain-containing protein n=1 Tax=Mytilus edulis TaxID=6550 RepID=A0A8S3U197_MYTED|nr:unnamed protein product [Mytilus edulis]